MGNEVGKTASRSSGKKPRRCHHMLWLVYCGNPRLTPCGGSAHMPSTCEPDLVRILNPIVRPCFVRANRRVKSKTECLSNDGVTKLAVFLVCDYAYSIRNTCAHKHSHLHLFPIAVDGVLATVSDLLECVCGTLADSLSRDCALRV